jgi:hypothetical protein
VARLARKRPVVELANEQVSITAACLLVGMDVPDDTGYGRSMRVRCPFGDVYHSDQGAEAAMRIYPDSNSAFCFSRCGYFTPVSLVATKWNISRHDAAVELLERAGIKPVSMAEAWAAAGIRDSPPDTTLLAEALKTFCARTAPDWADQQFDHRVAGTLARCFALLDKVGDDEDAHTWLAGCKTVMARALQPNGNLS